MSRVSDRRRDIREMIQRLMVHDLLRVWSSFDAEIVTSGNQRIEYLAVVFRLSDLQIACGVQLW